MISGWFLGGKVGSEGFGVLRDAGEGAPVTFGDPETSSLKTSFQRKVSTRSATGLYLGL